jgi:hypothetical protein
MLKLDSSDDAICDEFGGAANLDRRGMAGEVSTWRTKQTKPSLRNAAGLRRTEQVGLLV